MQLAGALHLYIKAACIPVLPESCMTNLKDFPETMDNQRRQLAKRQTTTPNS